MCTHGVIFRADYLLSVKYFAILVIGVFIRSVRATIGKVKFPFGSSISNIFLATLHQLQKPFFLSSVAPCLDALVHNLSRIPMYLI